MVIGQPPARSTVRADTLDDERFWEVSYPFLFPPQSFTAQIGVLPAMLALADCHAGVVLDSCCGPGRHAVPLAQRGFAVTGVDRSPFLLGHARAYGARAGVQVDWVQDDVRRFSRPDTYDLALNLTLSFGYFDHPEDNLQVLRSLIRALKPGATFLVEVVGKEILAAKAQGTGSWRAPGCGEVVQKRRVVRDRSQLKVEWIFDLEGEVHTFSNRTWLYSADELKQLLTTAGFTEIRLFGNLEGGAYDHRADALVARARKPS